MNRSLFILSLLLVIAASGIAQNQTKARVDKFVKGEMERQKIPGVSLAVIKDGKPLMVKGYGFANLEHQVPVKPETIFQSGSVGKQFTAAAIMLLVEDGKIVLDDKISKYLEGVPESWKNITVRHLLTHTNGLASYPEDIDFQRGYTDTELWTRIKQVRPTFQPGERWQYSNLGYVTLGFLITKVSGKPYYDLIQERIFSPSGMKTARIISEADIVPNRASGYRLVNGQVKNQDWVSPFMNTTADGSLYFSIRDMIKWDEALTKRKLLKKSSYDAMWTPVRLTDGTTHPYGFGWYLETVNGRRVIEHSGTWQGFESKIARYPDDNISIILFANLRAAQVSSMAHQIAAILNPKLKAGADDQEPTTTGRHRRLLQELYDGTADRALFTPEAAEVIFPLVERSRDEVKVFGAIENIELLNRKTEGGRHTNVYRVTFKNVKAIYTVILKDGKITSMDLRPE